MRDLCDQLPHNMASSSRSGRDNDPGCDQRQPKPPWASNKGKGREKPPDLPDQEGDQDDQLRPTKGGYKSKRDNGLSLQRMTGTDGKARTMIPLISRYPLFQQTAEPEHFVFANLVMTDANICRSGGYR